MKRIYLLLAVLIFACLTGTAYAATTYTEGDWEYKINDNIFRFTHYR